MQTLSNAIGGSNLMDNATVDRERVRNAAAVMDCFEVARW
jgi:hypothetical protein